MAIVWGVPNFRIFTVLLIKSSETAIESETMFVTNWAQLFKTNEDVSFEQTGPSRSKLTKLLVNVSLKCQMLKS